MLIPTAFAIGTTGVPTITRLEYQQKKKDRVNVYLDGEFAFGLNELDAALLRKGQVLTDRQILDMNFLVSGVLGKIAK